MRAASRAVRPVWGTPSRAMVATFMTLPPAQVQPPTWMRPSYHVKRDENRLNISAGSRLLSIMRSKNPATNGSVSDQRGIAMANQENAQEWGEEFWYSGKVTRRRFMGYGAAGAGALGATMLVPAPWQAAFGQAKPYKIGTLQPLSGAGAAGGKTALVGVQMAVDRINKSGGINGRPIELVIADDESKPDVGRRKTEKLLVEDKIDVHLGGFLSNICLACMPVFEEHEIVNIISVCLDTTLTTTKCNRYSFRPFDYAPSQAVAFAPYLVNNFGKRWHIAYADYSWGQSTRDAYTQEIKKAGGEVVETTGIPLGTADMTPFLSKVTGNFDGVFGIFFGKDGVTIGNQAFDLGLTRKYKWAGDGAIAESTNLPALGNKIEG